MIFIKKLVISIITIYYMFINKIIFKINRIGFNSISICGILTIRNKGKISIGDNFKANSGIRCNPIGGDTVLRLTTSAKGVIAIGNNVGISNSTIISYNKIIIEDNVLIGGGCKIWDTDFHSLDYKVRGTNNDIGVTKPIHIKKNTFIGAGTTILKGIIIGENSIIAAGSIVTKDVPDNEIWGGNPIKQIRRI